MRTLLLNNDIKGGLHRNVDSMVKKKQGCGPNWIVKSEEVHVAANTFIMSVTTAVLSGPGPLKPLPAVSHHKSRRLKSMLHYHQYRPGPSAMRSF